MFFQYATGFLCFCITSNYVLKTQMNMEKTAIWYLLHFICNMMVIYLTLENIQMCFTSPNECYNTDNFDSSALALTVGLHTFHIVRDYKTLTIIDWLHHLISSWFMTFIGVNNNHIPLRKCGTFFLTRIPVDFDYLLL